MAASTSVSATAAVTAITGTATAARTTATAATPDIMAIRSGGTATIIIQAPASMSTTAIAVRGCGTAENAHTGRPGSAHTGRRDSAQRRLPGQQGTSAGPRTGATSIIASVLGTATRQLVLRTAVNEDD